MQAPSALVRTRVTAFLNARFNAAFAAAAAGQGVTPFSIDFSSPNGPSFFRGQLSVDDIEKSGLYKPNLLTVFTIKSVNTHKQKPATFSGPVLYGIDLWVTYPSASPNQDFETLPECLEGVMYSLFNDRTNVWGPGLIYTGDIAVTAGPATPSSKGWRRLVAVTLTFEVIL